MSSENSQDSVEIDTFKRWSVPVLQKFLRQRNLKTTGRKEELVALAYSASIMNLPEVKSKEQEQKEKALTYADFLWTENEGALPDPMFDLKDGWLVETEGCSKWPPTMYHDICEYLDDEKLGLERKELRRRLMTDYKEGKAYSYFSSGWLKDIQYHEISKESTYCFLRAECTPSQSVNNVPHSLWVCIKKTGEVQSAYCSCFAGLGGTCNHVAAILFKVDYAWQWGVNNRSCTSKPCLWKTPGNKSAAVQPKTLSEMKIMRPHYSKGGKGTPINSSKRQLFTPTEKTRNKRSQTLENIFKALAPSCPDAAVFQLISKKAPQYDPAEDFNVSVSVEVTATKEVQLPKSLVEEAEKCQSVSELKEKLVYTKEEIEKIIEATMGQSNNQTWFSQRQGRITASQVHSVYTKTKSLSQKQVSTDSLVSRIMGYETAPSHIPALKYGRVMENEARRQYIKINSSRHVNLKVTETGLHIHPEKGFLGATPDGLVECDCCGSGLLEIKCPMSVSHASPTAENLPYLYKVGPDTRLKKSHAYYTQIQAQLEVCNKKWCDFFIFTKHGFHLERIEFNKLLVNNMLISVDSFFERYVALELICPKVKDVVVSTTNIKSTGCKKSEVPAVSSSIENKLPKLEQRKVKTRTRRKCNKKTNGKPIYMCGMCESICRESDETNVPAEFSIGCDKCRQWFHWGCVSFEATDTDNDEWFCSKCE